MTQRTSNYIQQSTEIRNMTNVPRICVQFVATVGEDRRNTLSYTTRRYLTI